MKKYIILFTCLIVLLDLEAQNYQGIQSSRFFPLQNVYNQPADLIHTSSRWNINIVSAQVGLVNNVAFNESNFLKALTRVGYGDLKYFLASEQSLLLARGNIMLPSVAYKLNNKHAFAFSMNLRADGIYSSSNDEITNLFRGYEDPTKLDDLSGEYFKSIVNQWIEYSLTWSGIVWQKDEHLLTGGVNLKYLVGGSSGYFNLDGIDVMYGPDKIDYFKVDVSYAINKNLGEAIDEGKIDLFGDKGFGADMGLTYSYKPEGAKNIPYKYKIGLSIGDIGYVKHSSDVRQSTFRVSIVDVPYSRFSGIESIEALIDSLQKSVDVEKVENKSLKMNLPANFMLTGDYCFHPNWYLAGYLTYQPELYHNLVNLLNKNIWKINLTPRFENKNWGAYLPVSYSTVFTRAGLALRWRYIYIGSSTFVSNLFKPEKGRGEMYFGINIPIGQVP